MKRTLALFSGGLLVMLAILYLLVVLGDPLRHSLREDQFSRIMPTIAEACNLSARTQLPGYFDLEKFPWFEKQHIKITRRYRETFEKKLPHRSALDLRVESLVFTQDYEKLVIHKYMIDGTICLVEFELDANHPIEPNCLKTLQNSFDESQVTISYRNSQ